MSRPRPISDATADLLLAGGEVGDPAVRDLAQVLAAASVPGSVWELRREDSATAAFAAAHLTRVTSHRQRPTIKNLLAKALGVKLAALAVAAAGGIALAASTGVLPDALHHDPSSRSPGPVTTTGGPAQPSTAMPTPRRTAPATSLSGLCVAYLAESQIDERNKNIPEDLATAAGGRDRVEAYCVGLVQSPRARPSRTPVVPSHSPVVPTRTPAVKSKSSIRPTT